MTCEIIYHHGIKGMRWGIRKYQNEDGTLTPAGKKRYAKEEYKQAKKTAKEKLRTARSNADSQYEKDMSEKGRALEAVRSKYDKKDEETKRYFDNEIGKVQKEADEAKEDTDFWEPGTDFHREASSRYIDAYSRINDLRVREDAVLVANKFERDNENIKINELFSESSKTAESKRALAYEKAGKEYVDSLKQAKEEYKKAKRG